MSPLTRAESTRYTETSRHADVMSFLSSLERRGDPRFALSDFGASPEGRTLPLVVLSADGHRTPEAAHARGKPVVLLLCGIHAGEVEGKEACQMLLRDLLDGADDGLLEQLTLVVVPLFNPDGNDRISPENRRLNLAKFEGQIGPDSGVGTRVNASGINLNRDYLRQDAPEMRQLATRVYQRWQPHLTVDCHATNGSIHRYDLTYDTAHTVESGRSEPIAFVRQQFLPEVTRRLRASTGRETFFYGNFVRDEGGEGPGWTTYTHHPRFGSNYRGLTNRLDILAETYSYLSFEERVATTYGFVRTVLDLAAERGQTLVSVVAACQRPPDRVAIRYRLEAEPCPVDILTRAPYALDGAPLTLRVPHFARFVGDVYATLPQAYALPESLVARYAGHGLRITRTEADRLVEVSVARVESRQDQGARAILEAAEGVADLSVSWRTESRRLPAGTALVPADQPKGAVAVYLSEPRSDDHLAICGWALSPAPGEDWPVLRLE